MRIAEAVELMSKRHLKWVLDSYTHDLPPMDEDQMRQTISSASKTLSETSRLQAKLHLFDLPHTTRTLLHFFLESLINAEKCMLSESELTEKIVAREQKLIDESQDPKALQYADERATDIFRTVLRVALKDDEISQDEFALLEELRKELKLSRKQQWLIEAQLGKFPSSVGDAHTHAEVKEAAKILEKKGLVFECRVDGESVFVLPEEVVPGVKQVLRIELSDHSRDKLWRSLPIRILQDVLKSLGLPIYGTKDEVVERLERSETKPQEALSSLKNDQLYEICSGLHGVAVSGSKDDKIRRIVDYFDNLVVRETEENAPRDQLAYNYLVELSRRDYGSLRTNELIAKDNEIERLFELGTTYVFEKIFGLATIPMQGSKHPDGCTVYPDDSLFLWDCKSQEKPYEFPVSHADQFKRYIREFRSYIEEPPSGRVNTFLVIVPSVEDAEDVGLRCRAAKATSGQDTDIAIITSEDLKWVAESWQNSKAKGGFNLHVFNETGVLTHRRLEQAMKLFKNF